MLSSCKTLATTKKPNRKPDISNTRKESNKNAKNDTNAIMLSHEHYRIEHKIDGIPKVKNCFSSYIPTSVSNDSNFLLIISQSINFYKVNRCNSYDESQLLPKDTRPNFGKRKRRDPFRRSFTFCSGTRP